MSCKQISELTGVRHDNVKRTIKTLSESGVISYPQIEFGKKSANGVVPSYYIFTGDQGERDSVIVIAQVSPQATAQLVDEWRSLKLEVIALRKHIADRDEARLGAPEMTHATEWYWLKERGVVKGHNFSNEFDMINRIVLGVTAKKYLDEHGFEPSTALRDTLTAVELEAIKTLQKLNTSLIEVSIPYQERKEKLQAFFDERFKFRMLNELLKIQG